MLYILFLIVPLLVYAGLSALILFHLKKYAIAGDFTQQIIIWFFTVSVVLIFFAAWSFFNIPWDQLNFTEMIQNAFGNNPFFYEQQ